jgi:hypothetical protein
MLPVANNMIPVAIPISMDTFYDRKYKSGLISFN